MKDFESLFIAATGHAHGPYDYQQRMRSRVR